METILREVYLKAQMLGVTAMIAATVDEVEWRQREQSGLGGLTDLDTLDGLLGFPPDWPLLMADLTPRELRLVDRLPDGVVDIDLGNGTLTRRARPVIDVSLATVKVRSWKTGLVKAGQFAPWCQRTMTLSAHPDDEAEACMQASYYGVGLTVHNNTEFAVLMEPEPWVRHRVTPAGWWFNEVAYEQLRAAT